MRFSAFLVVAVALCALLASADLQVRFFNSAPVPAMLSPDAADNYCQGGVSISSPADKVKTGGDVTWEYQAGPPGFCYTTYMAGTSDSGCKYQYTKGNDGKMDGIAMELDDASNCTLSSDGATGLVLTMGLF